MAIKPDPLVIRLLRDAQRYPILTAEHEREIALAWRQDRDRAALDELVGSHVRLVVKVARGFRGYGLPLADLVAEGNLGLMDAAERFEPERGCRFATYAIWWIRAAIQQYVLRSWSLVKIGTTAAQKKIFFNLRRLKQELDQFELGDLAPETTTAIASNLNVPEKEVTEMNRRMNGADHSLNAAVGGDSESDWLDLLPDERPIQDVVIGDIEEGRCRRRLMLAAVTTLDLRERDIIAARRLKETPATFEELSQRYAVSRERIRQIEASAISKMAASVTRQSRKSSLELAFDSTWPGIGLRASAGPSR
jgi:RNA polymerase sigma-32 factor